MADIDPLEGQGELQETGTKVRYSITVSIPPDRPSKRTGRGILESATDTPLPEFAMNQKFVLIFEDGSKARIQMDGKSNNFSLLA